MRLSQNSQYGGSKRSKQFSNDTTTIGTNKKFSSKGTPKLTEIPIYQLLKAFKLQQYTLKINELGFG